jgi:hypothetical protein
MGKFTLTHEIKCDVDTFWKTFFDKTFNERLYREVLGFPAFDILEQRETETSIIRKASGQPKMNAPAPVAKLMGSNFRYTEEATFDKATKVFRFKTIPSVMPDKVRNEGTVRVEPIGDGKHVRRITEIMVEAKVFGLGGIIESSTEKQMRDGWESSAAFMNKYLETAAG